MQHEWRPSEWGRTFTQSPDWRLSLRGHEILLTTAANELRLTIQGQSSIRVAQGLLWTDVTLISERGAEVKVDGLPNTQADTLIAALEVVFAELRARKDVDYLRRTHAAITSWLSSVDFTGAMAIARRRWVTHEMQASLITIRPTLDAAAIRARLKSPVVRGILDAEATSLEASLARWTADQTAYWGIRNSKHTDRELVACADLFDRVESKPLTEEQARAVICFDSRVQVVASAGSGKTSTMVAKAAYAIHRGLVKPEQIVLLAFNKKAAEELQERAAQSFKRLGMEGVSVETSTFHALGLRIIGKATGEKPDIPDWATDAAGGFRRLSEIVDQLKDGSPEFRTRWDLFRFVLSKGLPAFGSQGPADVWDTSGNGRILTARGERVRSQEEAEIANWLFYNGVDYTYEPPYEFRTATEDHRQYRPDFYYPGIQLYHEHFALDACGQAPAHFEGYLEGVAWKRQLHASQGTALFETTSHGIRSGADYPQLEKALTERGIVLDPNPDRPIPVGGQRPMEAAELVGLIRTFIGHAKSNGLTVQDMRQRLESLPADAGQHRHRMFLDIAAPVIEGWDKALAAEGGIDFEDMLNLAAEHLESGRYDSPFQLVMADEFQDASRARARLCRALVQKRGRFFFAVGDDWQSINRFAGADVSVMTGFREYFGHGQVLKLEQTFRCPQELCDVSSRFVSKNPAQIQKQVRSSTPASGPVLRAFEVEQRDQLASAVEHFLDQLCEGVRQGSIAPGRNGRVSVFILGRYNADRFYLPTKRARFERWLDLSFLTIHRSKGSEADFVILPEMISVSRGRSFPNNRADDPVLALAMPTGESFPMGEERRLFYVALTRARRGVVMFTAQGKRSSFLRELGDDGVVDVLGTDGEVIQEKGCPACEQGAIIMRTGPYGEFESCSNYPFCQYKPRQGRLAAPGSLGQARGRKVTALPAPRAAPSPSKVGTSASQVAKSRQPEHVLGTPMSSSHALPSSPSQAKTTRVTFGALLSAIGQSSQEISQKVSLASAIQEATMEIELSLHEERAVIEGAFKSAEAKTASQKYRDQSPEHEHHFNMAFEELSRLCEDRNPLERAAHRTVSPSTLFSEYARKPPHHDPVMHDAIQRRVLELIKSRSDFISSVRQRLSARPRLLVAFKESLSNLGGERYWAAINPTDSASDLKRLFERL